MIHVGRLLLRLEEEITTTDPVSADRLRAVRVGYLARYGRLDEARAEITNLRSRYETLPHPVVSPWIIFADSLVDRAAAQHDSSLLKMRKAHALGRSAGNSELHALSAAWLTHLYWNLQDIDVSVAFGTETLHICGPGDEAALIRVSLVLGEALILSNREETGQRWYRRARELAQKVGDMPSLSALAYNLTSVRLMLFRQAVLSGEGQITPHFLGAKTSESFDQAMGIGNDARTILQQARILSLQGEPGLALGLFVDHGQATVLEGTRLRSEWLSDEAWCRARLGDFDGALKTAEAAKKAIVKDTQIDDLAAIYSKLARTYRLAGDYEEAAALCIEAESYWEKYRQIQEDFGSKFEALSIQYVI